MIKTDKPRTKIDLQFLISVPAVMAVDSGFPSGLVDQTVVRDLNGLPYIPASTLKGRVRDMAESLARNFGQKICNGPHPSFMCPAIDRQENPCIICTTFGAAGISSVSGQTGLIWRDAQVCDENKKEIKPGWQTESENINTDDFFYTRTLVQLSRPRGVALAQHLFTRQNTMENLHFHGRVRGWLLNTLKQGERFSTELILLCGALKLLNYIGSDKSRGAGHCFVTLDQNISIDDVDVPIIDVLSEIEHLAQQGGK